MVEITPLFALPLVMLMLVLWVNVTKMRASKGVSIGDGGDAVLHEKIRRHGNFIEWVPLVLLVMLMAELRGTSAIWLYVGGALLLISRALHPFGLRANNPGHILRIVGNSGSLLALLIFVGTIIHSYFA